MSTFETGAHEGTRFATNGKANAGLTLGIIGTSLAGLLATGMGGGNGVLPIFGGGANCNEKMSTLQSRIAELESQRYTDAVGMSLYREIVGVAKSEDEKIRSVQADLLEAIASISKDTALNKQASDYQFALTNQKIDYEFALSNQKSECCCERLNTKIDYTNQINELSQAALLSYVNSNFIPGTLKLPITSICPQPTVE
jgi:acetylglutamate kinase